MLWRRLPFTSSSVSPGPSPRSVGELVKSSAPAVEGLDTLNEGTDTLSAFCSCTWPVAASSSRPTESTGVAVSIAVRIVETRLPVMVIFSVAAPAATAAGDCACAPHAAKVAIVIAVSRHDKPLVR
jgi:hypothetical protein